VGILISEKENFRKIRVEGNWNDEKSVYQDVLTLRFGVPTSKWYCKKEVQKNPTVVVGDLNIPVSATDGATIQKISKDV
jgi:hypothetical protein